MNGVMAVILRYFTEFGKHAFQDITALICDGIYAQVYSGGSKGGQGGGYGPPLMSGPTGPPNEALAQFGMAGIITVYLLRHRGSIVL